MPLVLYKYRRKRMKIEVSVHGIGVCLRGCHMIKQIIYKYKGSIREPFDLSHIVQFFFFTSAACWFRQHQWQHQQNCIIILLYLFRVPLAFTVYTNNGTVESGGGGETKYCTHE